MFFTIATSSVSIPTLPANIQQVRITLPASLRWGVMPALSPQVAYAEKLSKAMAQSPWLPSVIDKATMVKPMVKKESKIIANALLTESPDTFRPKISRLSLPFARLIMLRTAIANVVVLIPPPVDPGEAPIHIRNIMTSRVGKDWPAVFETLKPAVRALFPLKNAAIHFPHSVGCSDSTLSYSNTNVIMVENTIKARVVQITSRALKLITQ